MTSQSTVYHESIDTTVYAKIALSQAQRILSLGDLDQTSQTFACFDRYFWHYRQIDFANARFQEAVLYLAYLYQLNEDYNPFFNKLAIQKIIKAGIQFWQSIQNPDGSFNETYPYDRSYSATVNSTLAISLACDLLKLSAPQTNIQHACHWLIKNINDSTLRPDDLAKTLQLCLFCEKQMKTIHHSKLKEIILPKLCKQTHTTYHGHPIDWDTGTLSNTLESLMTVDQLLNNQEITDTITLYVDILSQRIIPEGFMPDAKQSRTANLIYPNGLLLLNDSRLIKHHLAALQQNKVIRPSWLDDRSCIPLTISYLQCHVNHRPQRT